MTPSLSANDNGCKIVTALGGRWTARGGMCCCPAHDDRTPSLSVRPGRRRLLFHCFAGCDTREVLSSLDRLNLLDRSLRVHADAPGFDRRPLRALAVKLWDEARSLASTAAERYLAGRGLGASSSALRFHPRAPHGRKPFTRFAPAIIAAVRDEQRLVGVHRTFLDWETEGLASLDPPRCALGRPGRGAVQLAPATHVLGLAEGVETALSAMLMFNMPCWATLGNERFGQVVIPSTVERLFLFPDNDQGGRRAETLARAAFNRLPIETLYPATPGDDWNDVLRRQLGLVADSRAEEERRAVGGQPGG